MLGRSRTLRREQQQSAAAGRVEWGVAALGDHGDVGEAGGRVDEVVVAGEAAETLRSSGEAGGFNLFGCAAIPLSLKRSSVTSGLGPRQPGGCLRGCPACLVS